MAALVWIIATVLIAPALVFVALRVASEMREDFRLQRKVDATKRVEVVGGKEYQVVTRSLAVLREKSTGRIGIVMERGRENDPKMVNGQIGFEPRWVKIQFVRKADGQAGRIEWRMLAKFEVIGTADVDFLTLLGKWFSTESFIRYPTNLGKLVGGKARQ